MTRRFPIWVSLLAFAARLCMGDTTYAGNLGIDQQYRQARTLQEFESIADTLQKSLENEPKNHDLHWRLARSHYSIAKHSEIDDAKINHFNQCIQHSSRALEIKPDSAISYFFRAICQGKQGEMQGIFASLGIIEPFEVDMKKALELDPAIEHGGPHRALGNLYLELPFFLGGNLDQSVYHLEEAVRLGPNYAENHLGLARAYYEKNNIESARKSLLTLMRLTDNVGDNETLLNFRKKGQELLREIAP